MRYQAVQSYVQYLFMHLIMLDLFISVGSVDYGWHCRIGIGRLLYVLCSRLRGTVHYGKHYKLGVISIGYLFIIQSIPSGENHRQIRS